MFKLTYARCFKFTCVALIAAALGGCKAHYENYNDCVLQKMKGEPYTVINEARNYCEGLFPDDSRPR